MSDYIAAAAEAVKSLVSQPSSSPSANGGAPGHVRLGAATGYQAATLDIEGGASIKCWFNPTQYSITKTNTWTVKAAAGKGKPKAQFGGAVPRVLGFLFEPATRLSAPEMPARISPSTPTDKDGKDGTLVPPR